MEIIAIEQKITEIEKKLDIVLHILGHGRTRSDAELKRMAEADMQRLRLMSERRKQRKERTS